MHYYLKKIGEAGAGVSYLLHDGKNCIGRSRDCDIRLPEPEISGRHFCIMLGGAEPLLDNQSSRGTMLDGSWITGAVALRAGQTITVGGKINLMFAAVDDISEINFADDPDAALPPRNGDADTSETTLAAPSMLMAETQLTGIDHATLADDEGITMFGGDQGTPDGQPDDDETQMGETRVLKTRVVSEEEIELLKNERNAEFKKKNLRKIAFLVLVGAVFWLMWIYRAPAREAVFDWPVKSGKPQTGKTALKFGGKDHGFYDIYYPLSNKSKVKISENEIVVNTFLGRDESVPMNLFFTKKNDLQQTGVTGVAAFRQWINKTIENAGGDSWTFGEISSIRFAGPENALPYFSCEYSRSNNDDSWYGSVNFFRCANEVMILRVEVPFEEERRCRDIMTGGPFLDPDIEFVRGAWSGTPSSGNADYRESLNLVRDKLPKVALNSLNQMEQNLRAVLRDALLNRDQETYAESLIQLKYLRLRLRNGFYTQQIKYNNAKLDRDESALRSVKNESEAIFSNPEDARYNIVRLNR